MAKKKAGNYFTKRPGSKARKKNLRYFVRSSNDCGCFFCTGHTKPFDGIRSRREREAFNYERKAWS